MIALALLRVRPQGLPSTCLRGRATVPEALLSKKQNINSSHKSLRRAFSLRRSIKDVARDL